MTHIVLGSCAIVSLVLIKDVKKDGLTEKLKQLDSKVNNVKIVIVLDMHNKKRFFGVGLMGFEFYTNSLRNFASLSANISVSDLTANSGFSIPLQ